jgi:hypothetical protein
MKKLIILVCVLVLGGSQVFAGSGVKLGSKASNASLGYFVQNPLGGSFSWEAGLGYIFASSGAANAYLFGTLPVVLSGFSFDAKAGLDFYSGNGSSTAFFAGIGIDRLFNQKNLSLELGADFGSTNNLVFQIGYTF